MVFGFLCFLINDVFLYLVSRYNKKIVLESIMQKV
jgi:hypothetical protein